MSIRLLTVPGYHGSGPDHWQTWLESRLASCQRVRGIDWDKPVLHNWASAIMAQIDERPQPVLLIAHSFGCLAAVIAAERRQQQVAGLILVAPADPERFGLFGHKQPGAGHSIAACLPATLDVPGLLVASQNDPWMSFRHAWAWSRRWRLTFVDAGQSGHLNAESGHGRWPLIAAMTRSVLESLEQKRQGFPARLSYPQFAADATLRPLFYA